MVEMEDGKGKDFKMHARTLDEQRTTPRVRNSRSSSAVLACGPLKEVGERWVAHKCHLNTQEAEVEE